MHPPIEMKKVSKSFDGVAALREIDFILNREEIVGLIGDNGAGKSTLVKILSGVHLPDRGELYIRGERVDFKKYNVASARRLGLETVYQERSLGEKQPLWRNLFAGRHLTNRLGLIKVGLEKQETEKVLRSVLGLSGIGARPDSPVRVLSGGERQGLAIGRAMYFQSEIVILDEPTTALSVQEVAKVMGFIHQLKASGKSAILISHNLPHVHAAADRFVFLDRGRVRGDFPKRDMNLQQLSDALMHLAVNGGEVDANGL